MASGIEIETLNLCFKNVSQKAYFPILKKHKLAATSLFLMFKACPMFMSSQVNVIAGIKKGPMEEIFFFLLPKNINSQISVTN